ncbi:Transcription factor [Rhizoctonia solani]|uniref:Transcription factor n=1 Tax=Rhizoctonia solani TaxID=456999 RepID=A0A8H7I4H9_9AGAM|nr:Transcription factor [Rhizoctonia solani]
MAEPRTKKTTLACDSCRRRKRKCDGRTPVCSLCEKGNIECVYDATIDQRRPAQKNYVAALEARVKLLEGILKVAGTGDISDPSGTNTDQTEEIDFEFAQLPEATSSASQTALNQPTAPLNPNTEPTFVPADAATTADGLQLMAQPQVDQSNTAQELDLGMEGYEPGASLELEHQLLAQFWDWQRMHLPYVAPVPFLSAYAIFSEAVHPGEPIPPPPPPPPPNPFSGPTAIGIPRASDVEPTPDLAQFISPLLLDAMFAIAALFRGNAEVSERFYERARLKLFDEVAKPRLATVQAATLMSTWELGHARAPATWTLNGVAVALCVRLGMNIDATPLVRSGAMSKRLFETRNFVFWTTYNFDRFGATCMGLHPLMDRRIISTPRHSSLAEANVLESSKKEETPTASSSTSGLASGSQSLPSERPTASDVATTWWNPSTLGMGDVLIQAGWEALRDLIRMSDMLFDGIYAFNAPSRTPREILELVTRNNVTIQRFLDDMPAWMRSTGAIRRKDNGLVYLHLFTHLTSILTCRPFLTPPAPSTGVISNNTSTEVSQATSSSHIIRRYRTLAFRVARASALQIMSLVRHIPLSSPCVTLPYAIYSACTILLLSPEDPAAMDGVRTGLVCLDSMDETGYWVDSAKDASDRIKALARRWSVVIGPGKRVLGLLPSSGPSVSTEGASGSGERPSRPQTGDLTAAGDSSQGTQSSSPAAVEANIPSGSQSGQLSAETTRPSTGADSIPLSSNTQTHIPTQPTSYSHNLPMYAPQAYTGDATTVPTRHYDLSFQEADIDAAIAQALQDFGSTQNYESPAQPSEYIPPPQYARDPVAMRRRQEQRQSQGEQGRPHQVQYPQQVQHHHPYIRQPKPTRKQQPMPHVAYALSHAEPQHDLHIDIIIGMPCFHLTPTSRSRPTQPRVPTWQPVSHTRLSIRMTRHFFPAMTFDTYYSPSQVGSSSGAAGPSMYTQVPEGYGGQGGYGYMGGPGM